MSILVLNCGSSSIKYSLFAPADDSLLASGACEGIGEAGGGAPDHDTALAQILSGLDARDIGAVGHRVVHGGARYRTPQRVTPALLRELAALDALAPLHNPVNRLGIERALARFPQLPQVAVFDTAFHAGMPEVAWRYALPRQWLQDHGVRRYGFHGISHQYVCAEAARLLGRPPQELRLISLHLGNGASAAAVEGGRCVDTSMGMTPLEGLVMGSRGGDVDPGVLLHLQRRGMSAAELEQALNRESGLQGLCGDNDLRRVWARADAGDDDAALALDLYAYRLRKCIGAYLAVLGGVDALVFTAGVGEHDARMRERVLQGLEGFGLLLDPHANAAGDGARDLSAAGATVRTLVIPTDEALAIAREVRALLD